MEFQDGAEDTSLMPSMRHRRRKRRIWPIIVPGIVLIGWGAIPAVVHQVNESQVDQQISRQIAASPTSAPTATSSVSISPPSSSAPVPALEPAPTSHPVQVTATQPDSIPINLTCETAGIIDLSVLPLPAQANPSKVDPPATAKAVFWNPTPIIEDSQQYKIGPDSQTTGLIQAHYLIDAAPEAGFPFNKLSYQQYFPVGSICTVQTDNGKMLTYREEVTKALTMDQWNDDPRFGILSGPNRGYDLILQACDASDPYVLKRLVGFKLVR